MAHIILILGKAGEKEKAHYSVDKGLNLALNANLNKISKNFSTANAGKNSAQMPLFCHLKSVAFTPFCPCFYKDDLKSIHRKVGFSPCKCSAQKAP